MTKAALLLALCGITMGTRGAETPPLEPVVEVEEDLYSYQSATNGAGPMWCHGSTCLVRVGAEVFAGGLETIKDAKPLNNCRWLLFRRGSNRWEQVHADPAGRTREPCPVAGFPSGELFVSVNPTLTPPDTYSGPARPEVLLFSAANSQAPWQTLLPTWDGKPRFSEHSYRSFAADGPRSDFGRGFEGLNGRM